jgi:hypothetical protein
VVEFFFKKYKERVISFKCATPVFSYLNSG